MKKVHIEDTICISHRCALLAKNIEDNETVKYSYKKEEQN